jgi:hypothetical protein
LDNFIGSRQRSVGDRRHLGSSVVSNPIGANYFVGLIEEQQKRVLTRTLEELDVRPSLPPVVAVEYGVAKRPVGIHFIHFQSSIVVAVIGLIKANERLAAAVKEAWVGLP